MSTTPCHALITGGGAGIGGAIADALAHSGMRLTLVGRQRAALEHKARDLPHAQALVTDVTDANAVTALFMEAQRAFGRVHILINNAGGIVTQPFARLTLDVWEQQHLQNSTSAFLCSQAFLAQAERTSFGRIVNVASTAALKGYAYVAAYCAAKHSMLGLTRALAQELARTAITVNAVCPGYTDTALVRDSIAAVANRTGRSAQDVQSRLLSVNPQGRLVEPCEVASAVAWLCSPAAAAVNGQSIAVCGGEIAA